MDEHDSGWRGGIHLHRASSLPVRRAPRVPLWALLPAGGCGRPRSAFEARKITNYVVYNLSEKVYNNPLGKIEKYTQTTQRERRDIPVSGGFASAAGGRSAAVRPHLPAHAHAHRGARRPRARPRPPLRSYTPPPKTPSKALNTAINTLTPPARSYPHTTMNP